MVPDVIARLAGNEITVTIDVIEDSTDESGFVFHATDLYEKNKTSTSITIGSPPPEIPMITLTDVSICLTHFTF